jgi:hypothetical protein
MLRHVIGSNETRVQMSSQIWSTFVYLGPPSLWITINPSDINNPVAQLFAGGSIYSQDGIHCAVSDPQRQAQLIADDPYAAAKFFHFLIKTILETLFQIRIDAIKVTTGIGVLGRVAAYFGLVESKVGELCTCIC